MHNPEGTTQDQTPPNQAAQGLPPPNQTAQGQMPQDQILQNQPLEEILPTALIIRAEYLILFNLFD